MTGLFSLTAFTSLSEVCPQNLTRVSSCACLDLQLRPNIPLFEDYNTRKCCNGPLEAVKWMLKQSSAPEDTAAILIEPIQGEGGFLTPPPGFLDGLRKICDDNGILLIMDEVNISRLSMRLVIRGYRITFIIL